MIDLTKCTKTHFFSSTTEKTLIIILKPLKKTSGEITKLL